MITEKHKYLGKWYAPGDDFKDNDHEKWACSPVRNYGKKTRRQIMQQKK